MPTPIGAVDAILAKSSSILRNISSGGGGGTLTAGLFLKEFTGSTPWAHLDIAGTARSSSDDAETGKGGTGYGVRTLVELASTFSKPT